MSNVPLYDNLFNEITTNEDLSDKQKDEFMKMVKTLDVTGYEMIYVLIRVYQLENTEDKSTFKLPFGGKFLKEDIKFDLNSLPNRLKHMLYKFINIHVKTMAEENEKNVI
jgi:hypothetical protein